MNKRPDSEKHDMRLSVIVPVYNTASYLHKCVSSILSQSLPVHELILVDDGSVDASGEIAEEYARQHARVKVIHQKNQGTASARNAGIEAATGEYITFVDSDDYIDNRMYETLLTLIFETGSDIAICGMTVVYPDGSVYHPYKKGIRKTWNRRQAMIELNSYRYFNMSFCDAVFHRSLFEENGGKPSRLRFPVGRNSEDFFLMHKVIARARRVAYVSDPMYYYFQRPGSESRNTNVDLSLIEASAEQLEFYRENFPDIVEIAETAYVFAHLQLYSTFIRRNAECPPELEEMIKAAVHRYFRSVMRNTAISPIKKMQAVVFCCMPKLYDRVIRGRPHR